MKKYEPHNRGGHLEQRTVPDPLLDETPFLKDCITARHYEDGSPRESGLLMVKGGDCELVGWLKDPTAALVMKATGKDLRDLLATFELMLAADPPPWDRDDREISRRKKKK